MKQLKKTLLTLVALLAVTTGAWADDYFYLVVDGTTATLKYGDKGENPYFKDGFVPLWKTSTDDKLDIKGFTTITVDASCQNLTNLTSLPPVFQNFTALTVINNLENINTTSITRMAGLFYGCSSLQTLDLSDWNTASVTNMMNMFKGCLSLETIYVGEGWSTEKVTTSLNMFTGCTKLPNFDASIVDKTNAYAGGYLKAKPGTVLPTPNVNEWSLTMPAGNVTVTAEYFPQATAAEGALTAATGVAATTSEPLVTLDASKLTGATKLMYLTNKSTDPAPGYDAQGWSDKVPTADSFTEAGNVNVWYYPVGTDDEDPAKTFSDGDICATALTVTLAAAPTYDISFNAANANTIEAGKATVTVGGTAATLTEGKVTGVKMGQQVKMTAAQGYKFRKVEAKKTTDFTDCVSTTAWTGMDAMSPAFSTPEVTTSDGRKTRFAEVYRTDVSATGVIMQQTVNVANGTYIVELYANSCAAQDVTTDMADGATDVAYVFANDVKKFITSKIASAFSESGVYTLEVTVTDGQLTLGIGKEKAGTNWHTIQIKSLNQKASSGNE